MVQCAVKGCSSRSDVHNHGEEDVVHFHRVPKDPRLRKKWMRAIDKKHIKDSTRVCSLHFSKNSYYCPTKKGRKRLVCDSFPNLNLPASPTESSDDDDDEEESNIEIVKEIPAVKTIEPSVTKPVPTNIIVVPQSGTFRIEPILKQVIAPVNVVATAVPYVPVQVQAGKNLVRIAPAEGNLEQQCTTPLERQLMAEVKMLREAMDCLEDQNRRLLAKNHVLQQTLDNYEKECEFINSADLKTENGDFKPDIFGL